MALEAKHNIIISIAAYCIVGQLSFLASFGISQNNLAKYVGLKKVEKKASSEWLHWKIHRGWQQAPGFWQTSLPQLLASSAVNSTMTAIFAAVRSAPLQSLVHFVAVRQSSPCSDISDVPCSQPAVVTTVRLLLLALPACSPHCTTKMLVQLRTVMSFLLSSICSSCFFLLKLSIKSGSNNAALLCCWLRMSIGTSGLCKRVLTTN